MTLNREKAAFLENWTDLADERLEGRLVMWLPGDVMSGAVLLGMADALGLDYSVPEHMEETIAFLVDRVNPRVLKYTDDANEAEELLDREIAWAIISWNRTPRGLSLEGDERFAFMEPPGGHYAVDGYLWIDANTTHPILAQLFVDWRLSDDAQFPGLDSWNLSQREWGELHEGLLGPSYANAIPDWIRDDYNRFYPPFDEIASRYRQVDWEIYNRESPRWFQDWFDGIGF